VSKSVASCPKYVHIKACLLTGYKPRAWRQVKMMFIPPNRKVNYTKGKTYCPIIPPFFMEKMIQKFIKGMSMLKHWVMSATSITICLHTTEFHRNHNAPCNLTYTGRSGKEDVTLELC
jgi:hypothetical protein